MIYQKDVHTIQNAVWKLEQTLELLEDTYGFESWQVASVEVLLVSLKADLDSVPDMTKHILPGASTELNLY